MVREAAIVKTSDLRQINFGEGKRREEVVLLAIKPLQVRGFPAVLPEGFPFECYELALVHTS